MILLINIIIWTLMSGLLEASYSIDGHFNCPCSQSNLQNSTVQSFIGSDYFCESGNLRTHGYILDLYTLSKIHCGMVKVVVLLKKIVVQLLVFHGLTMSS